MWKIQALLLTTFLFNLSLSVPLKDSNTDNILKNQNIFHGETKNWKVKNGKSSKENKQVLRSEYSSYRLPNNTIPLRYDLWLKTDVDKGNFEFEGRVLIHIRALETTGYVILHARQLNISTVIYISPQFRTYLSHEYIEPYEFVRFSLPGDIVAGTDIGLEISYTGTLRDDEAGFYRAFYYEDNGDVIHYATSQFESTDARHAMPCYDEPGIRAPIGVQIQHDNSYEAVSNMPAVERAIVLETNYVVTRFRDTLSMQTYLLAFLISPFKSVSNENLRVPQRIYAKPSSIAAGEAQFAADVSDKILTTYENHLGVLYDLPKLDHAAITQFAAGAMENYGLILYRDYLLLTTFDSPEQRKFIISIMSHEIAHQWFGNLVSPRWWSDLWLNEGFATWYAYYISHLAFPELGFYDDARGSLSYSMGMDSSPNAVPMSYYVETPDDIERRFDYVSYDKAGTILRMFQEALSERTFTKGVNKYLNKMKYSAAEPKDLFESIQLAYNEDNPGNSLNMESIWSTWVYQAGYPIISVDSNETHLLLTQNRYLNGNELYSVPISFATQSNPNFDKKTVGLWFTTREAQIPLSTLNMRQTEWIILNIQQTGFYRVSYSDKLWQLLATVLSENHRTVHPINRAVLLNELVIGYLEMQTVSPVTTMEVIEYVKYEEELGGTFVLNIVLILDSLYSSIFGTALLDKYYLYVQTLAFVPLSRLGFDERDDDDFMTLFTRIIWKQIYCAALGQTCLQQEKEKLHAYLIDESNAPVQDFCAAFRLANESIFHHYLNELATNPDLQYRFEITVSLGCTLSKDLLEDLIAVVEDTSNIIEDFERIDIIWSIFSSSVTGFEVAYAYVKRNVDQISSYMYLIAELINTYEYYEDFKLVLAEGVDGGFINEFEVDFVLSTIEEHFAWQDMYWEGLIEYFGAFNDTTPPVITTSVPIPSIITTTGTPIAPPPTPPITPSPSDPPTPTSTESTTTDGSSKAAFTTIYLLIASIAFNFLIYDS